MLVIDVRPLAIVVSEQPEHLRLEAKGRFSRQSFFDLAERVARESRDCGRESVLVDLTGVYFGDRILVMDRFDLGVYCAERLRGIHRLAVVGLRRHITWLFEDVAVNRGLNALVVPEDGVDAARRWLAGGPRPARPAH